MDKMKNKKFDEIVIPENLSQRMREGIEEGEKIYMRNKRNRMIRRGLTAAAAFMICVGFFASQPALASRLPVIRNIFRLFQEDYSYQGDLDAVAVKLEEPEDTPEEMSVYTKTEGGVTVSISEAYCSVEAIYLSLMISSEEGFPDTMTDMEDKPLIGRNDRVFFLPERKRAGNRNAGREIFGQPYLCGNLPYRYFGYCRK